jgi:integrase/recombinase XerD
MLYRLPQDELEKNTVRNYEYLLTGFTAQFGDRERESLTSEEILSFLSRLTERARQSTKRPRFSLLRAFFSFIINSGNEKFVNPCESPLLRKTFKDQKSVPRKIVEKEPVDEVIFRTSNKRNRLILELTARGGMRIGEVLNLRPCDIEGGMIVIQSPKSGRQTEIAFVPQKLAHRLEEFIRQEGVEPNQRIFPISYPAARMVVKKAGEIVGINLKPHDLRRHAATYASRSGMPIEIVSKVILRHSNLATTQRYLGKVTDMEAMRWIENLHG